MPVCRLEHTYPEYFLVIICRALPASMRSHLQGWQRRYTWLLGRQGWHFAKHTESSKGDRNISEHRYDRGLRDDRHSSSREVLGFGDCGLQRNVLPWDLYAWDDVVMGFSDTNRWDFLLVLPESPRPHGIRSFVIQICLLWFWFGSSSARLPWLLCSRELARTNMMFDFDLPYVCLQTYALASFVLRFFHHLHFVPYDEVEHILLVGSGGGQSLSANAMLTLSEATGMLRHVASHVFACSCVYLQMHVRMEMKTR